MAKRDDLNIPPDLASSPSAGEPKPTEQELTTSRPDWSYWANLGAVEVMDAVYLSLDIDPKTARKRQDVAKYLPGVRSRFDVAVSNMAAGTLPAYVTEADRYYDRAGTAVKLPEFRGWGESLPHPITFPEGFPAAGTVAQSVAVPLSATEMEKPLSTREKNNLLRIIRALAVMNSLPEKGYAESIRAQLDSLGISAPSDDTIRKAVEAARALDS